jgi:hypothetical protein
MYHRSKHRQTHSPDHRALSSWLANPPCAGLGAVLPTLKPHCDIFHFKVFQQERVISLHFYSLHYHHIDDLVFSAMKGVSHGSSRGKQLLAPAVQQLLQLSTRCGQVRRHVCCLSDKPSVQFDFGFLFRKQASRFRQSAAPEHNEVKKTVHFAEQRLRPGLPEGPGPRGQQTKWLRVPAPKPATEADTVATAAFKGATSIAVDI